MLLAVDMGNTNIVVGVLDGTTIVYSGRIGTDRNKTNMDFLIQLKLMMSIFQIRMEDIDDGILSSVVPELTLQLSQAMEQLLGKPILVVSPSLRTGLDIRIDNPSTLGNDRIADAVCAIAEYPCPIMIIDMGTATTISVIDANKAHIGGMIIPGVRTSLTSLSQHASQLPFISIEAPKRMIGTNTADCMKSGIVYGYASMLDGLIERISDELQAQVTVVATGGLAKLITPYCKHKIVYEENLLLKGLYYIYTSVKGKN